jgi:anti-sigma factor RsiW
LRSHPDELHTLAAAYVLGSLPPDEHAEFEAHLGGCEACAGEVTELQQVMLGLSAEHERTPPAELRESILTAADDAVPATSHDNVVRLQPDRRPTAQPWFVRLTAVAAAVLALVVAGLSYVVSDLADRLQVSEQATQTVRQDAERFAGLLAAPDVQIATTETVEGVSARLLYSADRDEAIITTDRLQPAPDERTYQLWVIDDDGPSSAGTFNTDPQGQAIVQLAGDLDTGVTIGITEEPDGGSNEPTTEPILALELD